MPYAWENDLYDWEADLDAPDAAPVAAAPPAKRKPPSRLFRIPGAGLGARAIEGVFDLGSKAVAGVGGLLALPFGNDAAASTVEAIEGFLGPQRASEEAVQQDPLYRGLGKAMEVAARPFAPLGKIDEAVANAGPGVSTFVPAAQEAIIDALSILPPERIASAATAPVRAARQSIRESQGIMGARTPREVSEAAGFRTRPSDRAAAGEEVTRRAKLGEAMAGSSDLRRDAILGNLDRVDDFAREDLGVAPGTRLTEDVFVRVEAPHREAYNAVERIPNVQFDDDLLAELNTIGGTNPLTPPTPAIQQLQQDILAQSGASGLHLRQKISDLRQQARDNLAASSGEQLAPRDRALGNAQIKAANALEGLLERNISPEMLADYRKARQTFALTNMLRRAQTKGERIDPQAIRAEAEVNPAIKGRMGIVADQAGRYDKVFTANVPDPASGAQHTMARMGSGALVGATGGGTLFGLPGAIGGAIGGVAAPGLVRRSMNKVSPAPNIEAAAPSFFPKPQPRPVPQVPWAPNAGPQVPAGPPVPEHLRWQLENPPRGNVLPMSQDDLRLAGPPMEAVDAAGGIPVPRQPLAALEADTLPWEPVTPAQVGPMRGPGGSIVDELGLVPEFPGLNEGIPLPGVPARPRGVSGPLSAQLGGRRPPEGFELEPSAPPPDYLPARNWDDVTPPEGGPMPWEIGGAQDIRAKLAADIDAAGGDSAAFLADELALVDDAVPAPATQKLYRGVPEGADPMAPNERNFTTWSGQRSGEYGADRYGSNVGEMDFDPAANVHLGTLEEARAAFGLGPDATAQDIAEAAMRNHRGEYSTASYDLPPGQDGVPREYIKFGPDRGPEPASAKEAVDRAIAPELPSSVAGHYEDTVAPRIASIDRSKLTPVQRSALAKAEDDFKAASRSSDPEAADVDGALQKLDRLSLKYAKLTREE